MRKTPPLKTVLTLAVTMRLLVVALVASIEDDSRIKWARSLNQTNETVLVEIDTQVCPNPESFWLGENNGALSIKAHDVQGAMYALVELNRQMKWGKPSESVSADGAGGGVSFRAIKFNLPFMSYRFGESLESNYETCRSLKFWEGFLDMMVENRFNVLSMWSLHPFHYMVKLEDYPEACPFSEAEMKEWRELWSGIFSMAKERGIETYLVNWNTFTSPNFARAHGVANWSEGWNHYGEGTDSELVKNYTARTIEAVINEYPDLTGLGITLGERMGGQDADERREWLEESIFEGMRNADRKIKFLYRAPLSANKSSGGSTSEENDRKSRFQMESMDYAQQPIYVSFKYNWSHGHSAPKLFHVHGGKLSDAYWNPEPTKHKILWTIRNEDFHILRWGDPDFIREHMAEAVKSYVAGYIIGSEVYIPAYDYMSRDGAHKTWDYAWERQWLFYAVWGRLLYEPSVQDIDFESLLDERFGKGKGERLLKAWKLASKTPLRFASFYKGKNDLSLYTEGHVSWGELTPPRFIGVDRLISHEVLDEDSYINIREWVSKGEKTTGSQMSPLELADLLDKDALKSMRIVDELRTGDGVSETLRAELMDIECWYWYARFFASQIRGGVELERFRKTNKDEHRTASFGHLRSAALQWQRLSMQIDTYYHRELPFYAGIPFSWMKYIEDTMKDFQMVKNMEPGE